MRILVTGATGLIGRALVDRLTGHELVLVVRNVEQARRQWPSARVVPGDFGATDDTPWDAYLDGVDAVINAVGIFREKAGQTFDTVHVKGPLRLFTAVAQRGVARIVQISALGADPHHDVAYLATKGRADTGLAALPVTSTVVQPSLVFSPDGPSTRWFAALAVLPLTPVPGQGHQRIQPVHLDDLCDAIVQLLAMPHPPAQLQAVGPEPITLRHYLMTLKRALGAGGGVCSVPMPWLRWAGRWVGQRSDWMAPDTLAMLDAGSVAPPGGMTAVLGRLPRRVEHFVHHGNRSALRQAAVLNWLVPALRWAIALMWIFTGCVSAFAYPHEESYALLARTGLVGPEATVSLYGAAALDALLGLGLLMAPAWRRWNYTAQFLVITAYTIIISVWLPEYWLHPYGPILKNIPLLIAIAWAREFDTPHGHPGR